MVFFLTFFMDYCVINHRVFSTCVMVPMSSSPHVVSLLHLFVKAAFFDVFYASAFCLPLF